MYSALTKDDSTLFRSVVASDFYAFDVGKRFTGDELIQFVKNAHSAGKIYVWKVTEPKVYIDGNTAWITYVNEVTARFQRQKRSKVAGVRRTSQRE